MTRKQNVMGKASGALGTALAEAIERDYTNVRAFAKRIGYTSWTVWRWVQNEKSPSAEAAACIVTLYPDLQPLLEQRGSYRRKTLPLGKRAETTEQAHVRIAEARRAAAGFAADLALPRPSEATKAARRPLLALLIAARKEQAMVDRARESERRKATTRAVRKTMPGNTRRVSHSGDFIEHVSEITASDVGFIPTYKMEGL